MEGNRFDDLARSLATRRSRRAFLRAGGGGVAGGLLALMGARRAPAADKVTICHEPGTPAQQTLSVATASVPAHLAHGDYANTAGCCTAGVPVCVDGAGSGTCCPAPSRCLAGGACCTPTTCAAQGKDCGAIADGCGGPLECGACIEPQSCGGGPDGAPNVCGCTPTTCAAQGSTCGSIPDGCGGPLDCGACDASACLVCDDDHACVTTCASGRVCCGGGVCGLGTGTSGCVADGDCCSGTCVAGVCQAAPGGEGTACDSAADCANGVPCVNGVCCRAETCASLGATCGTPLDGCGGTLSCGECPDPQTCGGGGTPGVCGCTPNNCVNIDAQCGEYPDGCGDTLNCGTCPEGSACNAGGCVEFCDGLGTICSSTDQCCPGLPCDEVYDESNRHLTRCCLPPQNTCTDHSECCTPPIPGSPIPNYRITAICNSGTCCVPPAYFCRNSFDCCNGSVCTEHPRQYCKADLDLTCCLPVGSACSAPQGDCECCSGYCINGTCADKVCLTAFAPCPADPHDCCSGTCDASGSFCAPFGVGCLPIGAACDYLGSSCCSGNCVDGQCGPYV